MKPAFNVKSARLDALAVQLHGRDLAHVRETLQQNIEKYIRFKSLPFVLDISAIESPEDLPIGEIAALFALYEINIVALRHSDAAVAALAAKHELSFVGTQRSELAADLDGETAASAAESETDDAEEQGADYEAVAADTQTETAAPTHDDDMLYNDNDAVKTVEMAKEADLLDVTPDNPATSMEVGDAPDSEAACEKVSVNASKPTIVVSAPVRTGQQIYAEQADLIVLGSVSPGAEVIADGNIHIYAPLRGRALAGASGDTNARIFVQSMQAELVSIAGIYRVFEQSLPQHLHRKPVQIELHDDRLAIGAIHTE